MNKILVLGASGQLGSRIVADVGNCVGTYNSNNGKRNPDFFHFDISNVTELSNIVKFTHSNVIINCIGLTNVDECEKFPEKNWLINNRFPIELANYCKLNSIKFIQISTDHFEGAENKIISESSYVTSPNQYSFAKLSAEKMIRDINIDSIIVRANFFQFNPEKPKTFIDKMIDQVTLNHTIQSFHDVYFTPVSVSYLIKYMLKMLEINFSGIINISSDQVISKFGFHELILDSYKLDTNNHKPISVNDVNLFAKRSNFMGLDNGKLKRLLGDIKLDIYDMIVEEKNYQEQRARVAKR
jgi:dTDP-4-dehydrorhamnose reductase